MLRGLRGVRHDARASLAQERRRAARSLLGGIVQERDVDLVFGYLREALNAAIEGREAAPPDELAQRAEAMGEEMKRRGAVAAARAHRRHRAAVREGSASSAAGYRRQPVQRSSGLNTVLGVPWFPRRYRAASDSSAVDIPCTFVPDPPVASALHPSRE